MNKSILVSVVAASVSLLTLAATSSPKNRLTVRRISELTAPTSMTAVADSEVYGVRISGFPRASIRTEQAATIEMIRELHYPTEFDPPQAPQHIESPQTGVAGAVPIVPTTPTAFETINTGWTISILLKTRGKVVEVIGTADYVTADLVNAGYGALAGPIFSDRGEVITPNKLDQPRSQTTTTRFHLFAVPGESYDITLFRGTKPEKHAFVLTAE